MKPEDIPERDIHFMTRFTYVAPMVEDVTWGEHEMDYVLVIAKPVRIVPNKKEVKACEYVTREQLDAMLGKLKLCLSVCRSRRELYATRRICVYAECYEITTWLVILSALYYHPHCCIADHHSAIVCHRPASYAYRVTVKAEKGEMKMSSWFYKIAKLWLPKYWDNLDNLDACKQQHVIYRDTITFGKDRRV